MLNTRNWHSASEDQFLLKGYYLNLLNIQILHFIKTALIIFITTGLGLYRLLVFCPTSVAAATDIYLRNLPEFKHANLSLTSYVKPTMMPLSFHYSSKETFAVSCFFHRLFASVMAISVHSLISIISFVKLY